MKNSTKLLVAASLLSASSFASANLTASAGYSNIGDQDVDLGVVYASAGYEFTNGDVTFMPELRIGTGVSDETLSLIHI